MPYCDKCGLVVHPRNDAAMLDAIFRNDMTMALLGAGRHLFPVHDEEGNILCEGSPSRAQYIEGQPNDTRGYPYVPELEHKIRAAYAALCALNPEPVIA